MWKWMGLFLMKKSSFKMLGLTFSSKLDWGSYMISVAKTASKKTWALIRSMKFLSPEVALHSINLRDTIVMPGLVLLVATWNCWISYKNGYAGLLKSLSLFYRYYFGRCSAELDELVPFPYSPGRSTLYSDRLHEFSVTIPRCYKDVYVNSFFPSTGRFWNSLPIECFPLNYDLNGFKSRISRYLLTVGSH